MPTVSNVNLTLSDSGGQVRATVTYDVDVTPFERQLVGARRGVPLPHRPPRLRRR